MTAPGSPPGPPPPLPPGPATGFGGQPLPDSARAGGLPVLAIVPSFTLLGPLDSQRMQLVRGAYSSVEITNVGCCSAWVGGPSVKAGVGLRIRPGETETIPSGTTDGIWGIADNGGAVLELNVQQ